MQTADLFKDALTEIADGPRIGGHGNLTKALMERLAEKGMTLAQCADPRMMKRSLATLQKHAREYGLQFPDYVPLSMRPKLVFMRSGDFYELRGEHVAAVASTLEIPVRGKGDAAMVAVPAHGFDDAREALEAKFYVVKKVKAKRQPRTSPGAPEKFRLTVRYHAPADELWQAASGHPGGWRVIRVFAGKPMEELKRRDGREALFRSKAAADKRAAELNEAANG